MIYLQMPKTGTSAVIAILDHNRPGHDNFHDHEPLDRDLSGEDLVFGTIRDPFDWYLSMWASNNEPCLAHVKYGRGANDPRHFRTFMKELEDPDIRKRLGRGFDSSSHGFYSHHARRVYRRNGEWHTDRFVKLESFRPTLEAIIGDYEDPPEPNLNAFSRKRSNEFYWDDEARDRVYRLDGATMSHFGYS